MVPSSFVLLIPVFPIASSKSVSELFYENGINVNPSVDKDLFAGINRVKSYFKNNKLFIFKNCVNLIREIKAYRWGKEDLPIKKDDHSLDELRYYVMSRPHNEKQSAPLTEIQMDKLRLIRKVARRKGGKYG
jgi:hypothetical protein